MPIKHIAAAIPLLAALMCSISCTERKVLSEPNAMKDDFSGFEESRQMFEWASAPLEEIIRFYIEDGTQRVLTGATVDRIVCSEPPRYLSGCKDKNEEASEDDKTKLTLARMGVVFDTVIYYTRSSGISESVRGVSTLTCQNLDKPSEVLIFHSFDVNGDLDELEKTLESKIYENY
ncbi:MAG: hypothetical protein AAF583_15240 [Pseudomonadota bacterium]